MVNDDHNVVLILWSYPLCVYTVTRNCWILEAIFYKNNQDTKWSKSVPKVTLEASQQELTWPGKHNSQGINTLTQPETEAWKFEVSYIKCLTSHVSKLTIQNISIFTHGNFSPFCGYWSLFISCRKQISAEDKLPRIHLHSELMCLLCCICFLAVLSSCNLGITYELTLML